MNKELKPLEALENIKEQIKIFYAMLDDRASNKNNLEPTLNKLSIIEKELKEGEKNKKALEIIIAKNVNIKLVSLCYYVDDYNDIEDEELTYDEFRSVKEVLL